MCCKQNKPIEEKVVMSLGGWSFEKDLYLFLRKHLEDGSVILELGSGYGTEVLSKHYTLFSIEHNKKFVDRYQSTYIHAPMKGHWYDVDIVKNKLAELNSKYDCIFVDGPVGSESKNRIGFFEHIDLFNTDVMLIIDDTNREGERHLFNKVIEHLGKDRLFYHSKTFSVIFPKDATDIDLDRVSIP